MVDHYCGLPVLPVKDSARRFMSLRRARQSFLPNFGSATTALQILLVAFGFSVIITLGRNPAWRPGAGEDLFQLTSLVMLIAIVCVIVLRLCTAPLRRLPIVAGAITAFMILVGTSLVVTELCVFFYFDLPWTLQAWPDWHVSLLIRVIVISAIISAFALRYMIVFNAGRIESEAQQEDRLQALQARIRPHFLFNSMNSIASLIGSDPQLAEKALEDLADVFRLVLSDARKMVPISAEGQVARQYLDIEKLRLGERLSVEWTSTNVPRSALLPSLTLQPLLENAVYHGIEPSYSGGTILVKLWAQDETLHISIQNPLPEVNAGVAYRRGNRIALENVRERLMRHFGGRATLQNAEQPGTYYVQITIPIIRG